MIWDRRDYTMEVVEQLNDKAAYKDVNFDKDLILNLTGKSNRLFESLKQRQMILEKEFKYFRFVFKKVLTEGSGSYCLKSTIDYQMHLEDQSFPIVRCLQKKYPNF